jgi:hypothetical protein
VTLIAEPENLDVVADGFKALVHELLNSRRNPSAWELVEEAESKLTPRVRLVMKGVLIESCHDSKLPRYFRQYLESLFAVDDEEGHRHISQLDEALLGAAPPRREAQSGIDSLLRQSKTYRDCTAFQEMINFMARFRDYAPYNNMLVKLQNPSCSFYATENDWGGRFGRKLKEDARPMLILAPMHPVLTVYELDQTEGPELPKELNQFARFDGEWDEAFLDRTVENAAVRDRIRVNFKRLSSTNAGFATIARDDAGHKMRIAIHEDLDSASRYGVLCHELAHIYLGHLGSDADYWWPSRINLDRHTVEVEAETVAYLVTSRLGLQGASASYVSRHLPSGDVPQAVSLDLIAKVASRVEDMARHKQSPRQLRGRRGRNR